MRRACLLVPAAFLLLAVTGRQALSNFLGPQPALPDRLRPVVERWGYPGARLGGAGGGSTGRDASFYATFTTPDDDARVWAFYWDRLAAPLAQDAAQARSGGAHRGARISWGSSQTLSYHGSSKGVTTGYTAVHLVAPRSAVGQLFVIRGDETVSVTITRAAGEEATQIVVVGERRRSREPD